MHTPGIYIEHMFVSHPAYIREKAIQLRVERKMTIDEIAERLSLPRITIYGWVRDIPIPRTDRQSLAQRKGTLAMQRKYRKLRDDAYAEGLDTFGELAAVPLFRDFVTLFLAEGYKRSRNKVSVANSDPAVIVVAQRWLLRLTDHALYYEFQYHADQDVSELRRYWGQLLDVAPESIRAQRKSNSNQLSKRTWRCQHGVMTVGANDTCLRARMQAWIDCLRAEWFDAEAMKTQARLEPTGRSSAW